MRWLAHRVMTPIAFLARLAALVPPPRYPLVRYHGVLAPHAKRRSVVVPKAPQRACEGEHAAGAGSVGNGDKNPAAARAAEGQITKRREIGTQETKCCFPRFSVTPFSRLPATLDGAALTLGHRSVALRKVSERGTVV
jgi:hypothetical protein